MPRASKNPIKKDISEEISNNFTSLVSNLDKKSQINLFFENFLTEEEQIMLSKRLMLHLLIQRKYKYSEIQSLLSVSNDTIRIHKMIWSKNSPEYKNILDKLIKKQELKEFWKKLDKIVKPLDLAIKSRTDMKARAKFASGSLDD